MPRVSFTVGVGWTAIQATSGFFDLQDVPGSLDVVAVQFADVAAATPEEAVAEIRGRDKLVVSDTNMTEVDGYAGLHLTVETSDPADTDPPIFRPVLTIAPGPISIASGRRLDITLVDVNGAVLGIFIGGSIAKWHHALDIGEPVVASVEIG
jgi:hypothetical protein